MNKTRRDFLKCIATSLWLPSVTQSAPAQTRPNVVWLSCEDISPHIGCFGDAHAITPHIDRLAQKGVRYTNTFTAAGVCAPCRSGIITGMYHTSIGTHHMRCKAKLPEHIKAFTSYLRDAGYYCTNNSKTDYQTGDLRDAWDQSSGKAHWRNRKPDQPFFSVFNFTGCHESGIAGESKYKQVTRDLKASQRQDPDALSLPPYYPDTPGTREDWKRNYELITAMDAWAGDLIGQLKAEGLYDNTIIFFWSDHGVGLPRAKRWLYDSGTHVPMVIRIPPAYRVNGQGVPNATDDQLISSIDFGPTVMNLAGVKRPGHMQGQPFLGRALPKPRDYVYGARDRMDERYDVIRSVRNKRFRYIRNYEPLKTYYQYMNTPEKGVTMKEIRRVHADGALPPAAQPFMQAQKPVEELYDLRTDPHEINNLAGDAKYKNTLETLRAVHLQWVQDTKDLGLIPESEIMQREIKYGNRYAILRQPNGDDLNRRLGRIAAAASQGMQALPELVNALADEDASVRYWAATGIGNIGPDAASTEGKLVSLLRDSAASVRVASARALARMDRANKALPVLTDVLIGPHPWARLQAAIVLDEMGSMARPAEAALTKALQDQPNKYITRVANHALNVMNGTDRKVK